MRQRYHLCCKFIRGDEIKAKEYCDEINKNATPYQRKKYPAHYTKYMPDDDCRVWCCWYYYKTW